MKEELICRICFESKKKSKLINPCECKEKIHKECLKKWIEVKNNPEVCEICKKKYNVDFTIIPVQQRAIIIDESNLQIFLNQEKFKAILILCALIFIILIYISFGGQPDNYNVPKNLSVPTTTTP